MARGQKRKRATASSELPAGLSRASDVQLTAGFSAIEPPQQVRWRLRPAVDVFAIACSDDRVLVVSDAELPLAGRKSVWASACVPSVVYSADRKAISGLTAATDASSVATHSETLASDPWKPMDDLSSPEMTEIAHTPSQAFQALQRGEIDAERYVELVRDEAAAVLADRIVAIRTARDDRAARRLLRAIEAA
jgi:hypothetical protein